jgi:hypothetical protein
MGPFKMLDALINYGSALGFLFAVASPTSIEEYLILATSPGVHPTLLLVGLEGLEPSAF